MDCETCRNEMADFFGDDAEPGAKPDGRDPAALRMLKPHLDECPGCRGFFEELQAVTADLDRVGCEEPPAVYWETFPSRVRGRIEAERRRSAYLRGALAAAALLVVAMAVFLAVPRLIRPPGSDVASTPRGAESDVFTELEKVIASVPAVDLEQVVPENGNGAASMFELAAELGPGWSAEDAGAPVAEEKGLLDLMDQVRPEDEKSLIDALTKELG